MRKSLFVLGAAFAFALSLAGCGGDDGAAGPPGATGAQGPAGTPGTPGAPGTNAGDTVVISQLTPEQWAGLQMKAEITSVAINSPPEVNFKITDQNGKPVIGLENSTTKGSTATLTSNANVRFELAKLIPGKDGSNSEWISYLVTTAPLTVVDTRNGNCPANTSCAWRPSTDETGTLVGNGDGTYKYTFWRDVRAIKADVAAWAAAQTPPKDISALGDLTFDGSLQHRLIIQISGAARGTGSNTANGVTVAPAVNLENVVNAVYDFIPATGAKIPPADLLKDVADVASCNACHQKLAFHGGGRTDVAYCTTCHTSQRAYGWSNTASTAGAFPALTETKTTNSVTGIVSYSYAPDMGIADGEVLGNFTTLIHKIHQGGSLSKVNYEYANVAFNLKNFSMLNDGQRMCTVCHNPAVATKAALAYQQPTRKACGACHDGVNWATGENHVGRAQADDKQCVLCHGENQTKIDHRMPYLTPNNPVIADGLVSFTYEIKEAKVTAGDVTITFRIQQQTSPSATLTPIELAAPAACVTNPLAGFTGGPSFLLAYAQTQDGVTTPADYNNFGRAQAQPRSVSLANLLTIGDTVVAPCTSTPNPLGVNGTLAKTATTPWDGYYIASIPATGAWEFPATAKMRAVALQGYFTQTGVDAALSGRHTKSVVKAVTGDAVRRTVADSAKCAKCHEYFEGHGGNRVYEVQVCVTCHVPGLATSGRGIADATLLGDPLATPPVTAWAFSAAEKKLLGEWGMMTTSGCDINGCTTGTFNSTLNVALGFPVTSNNMKDMIHGIHSGRDRAKPFQDARDRTPNAINLLDFRRMDFPGVLSNCEGCHVTATSATTTYNALPVGVLASTYESINATYLATPTVANAKASLATANPEDTIVTPFAASCASCHDGAVAKSHMDIMGAKIGVPRSGWMSGEVESCAICHGPGADFDTVKMHK